MLYILVAEVFVMKHLKPKVSQEECKAVFKKRFANIPGFITQATKSINCLVDLVNYLIKVYASVIDL